jgi:DNA-directed RNA polymerase subunit F
MSKGWVSVYRELQGHWLWEDRPFSRGQAWIDLLMSAGYTDNVVFIDGNALAVTRGSLVTSIVKLSERWGWSRTKTSDFLNLLAREGMIRQIRDSKKTIIDIVKYTIYQDPAAVENAAENHQKNIENTSEEKQKDTNNKENKENNITSGGSQRPIIEKILSTYPRKSDKSRAILEIENRAREGEDLAEMLEAAIHYTLSCRDKDTPEYRMYYPANFFGPDKIFKRFLSSIRPGRKTDETYKRREIIV